MRSFIPLSFFSIHTSKHQPVFFSFSFFSDWARGPIICLVGQIKNLLNHPSFFPLGACLCLELGWAHACHLWERPGLGAMMRLGVGPGMWERPFFKKKKGFWSRRRRKRVLEKEKFDIFLGLKYFFMERLVYNMLSLDFFFLIVSDSLRRIFLCLDPFADNACLAEIAASCKSISEGRQTTFIHTISLCRCTCATSLRTGKSGRDALSIASDRPTIREVSAYGFMTETILLTGFGFAESVIAYFSKFLAHRRRRVWVPRDDPGGLNTDRVSVARAGAVAGSALALNHPGREFVL